MLSSLARGAIVLCVVASSAVSQVSTQVQSIQIAGSAVEHQRVNAVSVGEHVRIEKLAIPGGFVDLELDRVEVLLPDAQIVVGTKSGMDELVRPDVVVLTGIVAGEVDSMAYLAISPYGTNGFVNLHGELISISTGPYAQGKDLHESLQAARMQDVLDPMNPDNAPLSSCGYNNGDVHLEPNGPMIEGQPITNRGAEPCRIAGIAIDTDWEFTRDLFGGNVDASAAYIVSLMGAISEIYQRDVNVRLAIPYLRVWGDDSDPYTLEIDPLAQVREYWNANMGSIDRTVAHYFTGRRDMDYGGVAYVGVLCNEEYGYGVSGYMNGSFPYPLEDHNSGNWDVMVASHELGHNFGTSHTHSYSPQIDGCGTDDCTLAFGGTIMSYCHGCPGGMSNLVLQFHPRVQDTIVAFMDTNGCDMLGQGVTAVADNLQTYEANPIEIDALGNDESQSCDAFELIAFDQVTISGGAVELLAGQGPGGRDVFLYTPTPGYNGIDSFEYTISGVVGSASTTVTIDVRALRNADERLEPASGLSVKYYELSNPVDLPDFDSLTPYATDVIAGIEFASTEGEFMNSGLSDNVGVLIEGYVWAFVDGLYTFSTSSDDGSSLYIGEEQVVDNGGLHPMLKRTGTIPLRAGWHRIRIEFFEQGGGAGLFATINGPAFNESVLGGIYVSHETSQQCSTADLNADGTLNFFDVSLFLSAFNDQDPIADITGEGNFDFFDISAFRQTFLAGCP